MAKSLRHNVTTHPVCQVPKCGFASQFAKFEEIGSRFASQGVLRCCNILIRFHAAEIENKHRNTFCTNGMFSYISVTLEFMIEHMQKTKHKTNKKLLSNAENGNNKKICLDILKCNANPCKLLIVWSRWFGLFGKNQSRSVWSKLETWKFTWPHSHRTRKQICAQICVQTLWCCLQPVWTLLFTAVCSIICMRGLQGAPCPVWTAPRDVQKTQYQWTNKGVYQRPSCALHNRSRHIGSWEQPCWSIAQAKGVKIEHWCPKGVPPPASSTTMAP